MSGAGHRWSKFWWADWENDPELRLCSLAAQAVWMRVLCVMHRSEPRGYLVVNGHDPNDKQLAAILGLPLKEVTQSMAELERNGVFKRDSTGIIFCSRMVRDTAASEAGREHIAKRWNGKPNGHPPNRDPNRDATRDPDSYPKRDPITKNLEVESEKEPPRSPPVGGGGAARRVKPHRNGFVELDRKLAALACGGRTIDGNTEDIVDFQAFSGKLRRIADG